MSTLIEQETIITKIKELEKQVNELQRIQTSIGVLNVGGDNGVVINGEENNIIISESGIPKIRLGKL